MIPPRHWLIGRATDCDLVVSRAEVSAHHCVLTQAGPDFVLEDLDSANGTLVNGRRITSRTPVTPADQITLGTQVAMPWPSLAAPFPESIIRIGREPDVTMMAIPTALVPKVRALLA